MDSRYRVVAKEYGLSFSPIGWAFFWTGLLFLGWACTPEDESLTNEEGAMLTFSQDTVQFDTVFTTVGSITQWLRVYNPQRNAVNIESISLGTGESDTSPFRMVVNGESGTQFQDVILRGGDSLLVLVEVAIDPQNNDLPFIVRDSIVFRTNSNVQNVGLEAWGQDAFFIKSGVVVENTTFSAGRPYVICDSLWVLPPATLTLEPGTQLYFGDNAYLFIASRLQAEGTSSNRILLQHVRNDGDFENAIGQWQGVFFGPDSRNNRLNFTAIRNARIGISVNSSDSDTIPDITLANTVIENMSEFGVYAQSTDIDVYNTVISNCALGLVRGVGRAHYRFRHCTMVNEPIGINREEDLLSLVFDARPTQNESDQSFFLDVSNSIIWGNLDYEFGILRLSNDPVTVKLTNTLIKALDNLDSLDVASAQATIYNEYPQFIDSQQHNYRLAPSSPAIDAGIASGISQDIVGNFRDARPDIGAYEYVE